MRRRFCIGWLPDRLRDPDMVGTAQDRSQTVELVSPDSLEARSTRHRHIVGGFDLGGPTHLPV